MYRKNELLFILESLGLVIACKGVRECDSLNLLDLSGLHLVLDLTASASQILSTSCLMEIKLNS